MKYIVDSSVGVKWAIAESDTDKALRVRDDFRAGVIELAAPDVFPVEFVHAITRAERQGRVSPDEGAELVADLERIYERTKAADKELKALLAATGTTVTQLHGIGPSGAARLLVESVGPGGIESEGADRHPLGLQRERERGPIAAPERQRCRNDIEGAEFGDFFEHDEHARLPHVILPVHERAQNLGQHEPR